MARLREIIMELDSLRRLGRLNSPFLENVMEQMDRVARDFDQLEAKQRRINERYGRN